MKTIRPLLFSLALTATALSAQAHAFGPSGTAADYGTPAGAGSAVAQRIVVQPGAKAVNVTNGDTVEFVVDGKTFRWHFDTYISDTNFKLAKIAPAGVAADGITVYVAPNPLYRGY